jgi:hypothetical protein
VAQVGGGLSLEQKLEVYRDAVDFEMDRCLCMPQCVRVCVFVCVFVCVCVCVCV